MILGDNKIRFHTGFGADYMNLKRGAAGYRVGKGNISLTLKPPDLLVGQNGVNTLLNVKRAKRFIRENALGSAVASAYLRGPAGAKVQLAAARANCSVEQLVNMNFIDG